MILVIGGTHGTGRLVAERLAGLGEVVRVLARRPAEAIAELGHAIEVMGGDVTAPASLLPVMQGVRAIVYTAGVRSGHLAGEATVRATDYQGVLNTLDAAEKTGVRGRFVYMTSIGVGTPSLAATLLNAVKGRTLAWRRQVEDRIRATVRDYTIVRAGFLLNGPAGRRAVSITQGALPLQLRYRIARADVAGALVAVLNHPSAARATFEIAWGSGRGQGDWTTLFSRLRSDP